jgi:hypothetical protein
LQDALYLARNLRIAYQTSWSDDIFRWATKLKDRLHELKVVPASEQGAGRTTAVLINLLGRPWFSRVWMIQEANARGLPSEVVIGACSARLIDFTLTAHYLAIMEDFWAERFGHPTPDYTFPAFYMQDIQFAIAHPAYKSLPQAYQLLVLLSMAAASYHSTDSRDRVYGLLGLVHQEEGQDLVIADYSESFENVVLDSAVALIEKTRSFAILALVDGVLSEIPSWAPAWNRPVIYARNETYFEEYFSSLINFPGKDAFHFLVSADRTQLSASGIIIGEVVLTHKIPEMATSADDPYKFQKNIDTLKTFEIELSQQTPFNRCLDPTEAGPSILAHVLEGCRYQWSWKDDIRKFDALMQRPLNDDGPPVDDAGNGFYLEALTKVVQDDIVFATDTGYIGRSLLGPYGAGVKKGDRIALFPGCPWPIHLRPTSGGFHVLGICYAHGWMEVEEQRGAFEREVSEKGALDPITLV